MKNDSSTQVAENVFWVHSFRSIRVLPFGAAWNMLPGWRKHRESKNALNTYPMPPWPLLGTIRPRGVRARIRSENGWFAWLTALASAATIGFGVWHFFVPNQWNWYSYMDPAATELVLAVRAIFLFFFFFSFSLILFGLVNVLIVFGETKSIYPLVVVLGASSLLWLARVVMQVIYPQGTINPVLQVGMLSGFVVVFLLHVTATFLAWRCAYCASYHS